MIMKKILLITGEAFEYSSEDPDKVKQAIDFVFPVEKKLRKERIESYHKVPFYKIIIEVKKQQEIKKLLKHWKGLLSEEDKEKIKKTVRDRVSDEGVLFVRFDKQAAFDKVLRVSYSGDVIRVTIKLTSYPFSLDKIMETAVSLF